LNEKHLEDYERKEQEQFQTLWLKSFKVAHFLWKKIDIHQRKGFSDLQNLLQFFRLRLMKKSSVSPLCFPFCFFIDLND